MQKQLTKQSSRELRVVADAYYCSKSCLLQEKALKPEFKEYQKQVVNNAKALADALIAEGFNLVSGGTDNHLMLVDLQNMNITGKRTSEPTGRGLHHSQ